MRRHTGAVPAGAPDDGAKASVIVPVHNAEAYIDQCLDCLVAQTESTIEVVVVDDGSTDATDRIVRARALTDPRIRHLRQDNRGVSAARNAGIAAARGGCLMFVDADDLVAPDFVETLLRLLGAPGCDCAAVGIGPFRNRPGDFGAGTARVFEGADALRAVMGPCRGFICNKAYRASIVRERGIRLREDVAQSEDMLFNLDYLTHCRRLAYDDGCRYQYRQHAVSATNAPGNRRWFDVLTVFEEFRRRLGADEAMGPQLSMNFLPVAHEGLHRYRSLRLNDPALLGGLEDMRAYCERDLPRLPAAFRLKMLVYRHAMGLVMRRRRGGLP